MGARPRVKGVLSLSNRRIGRYGSEWPFVKEEKERQRSDRSTPAP